MTETAQAKKTSQAARNGAQARTAAVRRLIETHREEFSKMYREEAEKRGVRTRVASRQAKIEKLKAELAALEES